MSFKQMAKVLAVAVVLSSPIFIQEEQVSAQEVNEIARSLHSERNAQSQPITLSAYMPPKPIAELFADLIAVEKYELAHDLALYSLHYRESEAYVPYFYAVQGFTNQRMGKNELAARDIEDVRRTARFSEVAPNSNLDLNNAFQLIEQQGSYSKTTSNRLGIWFYPHVTEKEIQELINEALHGRDYIYIDKAASFALEIRGYLDNPDFYLKRGIARYYLGKLEGAMSDFEKAKVLYRATGTMNERRQADWVIDKFAFLEED